MSITLTTAQAALDAWIAADLAVAKGQSYSMNGRSLTMANVSEIRGQIQYWERRVVALSNINASQASLADFTS
jgi:hypothetical protein